MRIRFYGTLRTFDISQSFTVVVVLILRVFSLYTLIFQFLWCWVKKVV